MYSQENINHNHGKETKMSIDFSKNEMTDQEKAFYDSNTAIMLRDDAKFSEDAINAIKGYPPLALALNEFLSGGGKIIHDPNYPTNNYNAERDEITLGLQGYGTTGQYEAVSEFRGQSLNY